jgi:hypothetical protein
MPSHSSCWYGHTPLLPVGGRSLAPAAAEQSIILNYNISPNERKGEKNYFFHFFWAECSSRQDSCASEAKKNKTRKNNTVSSPPLPLSLIFFLIFGFFGVYGVF